MNHFFRRRRLRSSHPTQLAAAKAVFDSRDGMVAEWADWLDDRAGSHIIPRPQVEREFRLIVDTLIEMLGPLRREAKAVWQQVCEHYGRTAAARGLAAGEVVEELQQLRVLLIKYIGPFVAAMRPRRAVAVFLRLNAIIDRGIAFAVVGYTDALVASMIVSDEQRSPLGEDHIADLTRQLDQFESALGTITARH